MGHRVIGTMARPELVLATCQFGPYSYSSSLCVCRLSPDQRGLRLLPHKERQELLRHCEVGEVVGLLSDVCISQLVPDKAAATADRISSISYRHFFHQQWNIQRLRLAEVRSALHP